MNINEIIKPYIDENYAIFHKRICSTKYQILGIKIPILKKISKELIKKYSYQEIMKNLNNKYYEHIMIEGLIIANSKIDYVTKLNLIDSFIPKIDNWAICDVFCSSLSFIKKNKIDFLNYLNNRLNNTSEYNLRFVIVSLLDYYIDDEYIDTVLDTILIIKSDYYYVKMAIAWCLSICLVKYFDKTKDYLLINKGKIDTWIYNKAIQKALESRRISKEEKIILKNMKSINVSDIIDSGE